MKDSSNIILTYDDFTTYKMKLDQENDSFEEMIQVYKSEKKKSNA